MGEPLLSIEDLTLTFPGPYGRQRILDRVSFDLQPHEIMGLVGESGSGKTMTSLATIGLLPPTARIESGHIRFDGRDLLAMTEREMRAVRGTQIAMIFQNPRGALNPLMRVGEQIARVVQLHSKLPKEAAYERAVEVMRHAGISDAATRARAYPHQLSGGMAQRVLIAMMLACQPRLLIADEPTTGLDVTIQAQIFELIKEVQAETGAALLLITHDLGVVAEVCQRVAVMYAGQIMEVAAVGELFSNPQHPYTERLLSSVLRVDRPTDLDTEHALAPARIRYDSLACRFTNQCLFAEPVCQAEFPPQVEVAAGHTVYCYRHVAGALEGAPAQADEGKA